MFARGPALKDAMSASLDPPLQRVKQLCPKGGPRIGTKSGKKHLADTYKKKVIQYDDGTVVGLVGAEYPAGAHSHNVEFGHDIVSGGKKAREGRRAPDKVGAVVGRAAPRPHVRPAAEQTQSEQKTAFETVLSARAAEASK